MKKIVFKKNSFIVGFEKGVFERDEQKKSEYFELGYKDGLSDIYKNPENVKELYLNSYQSGYDKAQDELKDKYFKQGYEAAFTTLEFKEPNVQNQKFINWYKEGFDSNNEIEEIKKAGYELGLDGQKLKVPKKYEKGQSIFINQYNKGYAEYEEKREKRQIAIGTIGGGSGAILLAWLARRFYNAKKMIS